MLNYSQYKHVPHKMALITIETKVPLLMSPHQNAYNWSLRSTTEQDCSGIKFLAKINAL